MRSRTRYAGLLLGAAGTVMALTGCGAGRPPVKEEVKGSMAAGEAGRYEVAGSLEIEDNFSLYEDWDSAEVETMYLTVRTGNKADGTDHTWQEVNTYSDSYYREKGIDRYKVEGLLQTGDENGPVAGELGYGQYAPNAMVQIRGQTSTEYEQKNYRIVIRDEKGEWNGQQTINLNKHERDACRFTNMLCYDLMSEIPGMMSARTKFVHLYVKDETLHGPGSEAAFEDYGLYTYVEQINKTYLQNHNLDKTGQLYKVNFFEFNRYEDVIKLKSDADYDENKFEEYLEIKGSDDHSKLIAMLEDINDYSKPIEEVFSKWFDEENYFSWLAFHILVGNKDTQSRNCFLYSPQNVDKFYFISWDNDASLRMAALEYTNWKDGLEYEEGISNYWGNILHRRVLQSPEYRAELDEEIQELKKIMTQDKMRSMIDNYAAVVKPYLYRAPDVVYAPVTMEEYDKIIEAMPEEVEKNYDRYEQSLQKPMPFYLGTPKAADQKIKFNWDTAYDFDQETIHYTFQLCGDYTFGDCIYEEKDMLIPEISLNMLQPGQYFFRVTAVNESGHEQMAFDYYNSSRGKEYGMVCFWVTEDGTIQVEADEE